MKEHQVKPFRLLLSFLKIGVFAFGGGYAILPIIENEVCKKQGWLTEDDIVHDYALGQSLPGIIALNTSSLLGYRLAGRIGSLMACLGIMIPAYISIIIIAIFLPAFQDNRFVAAAFAGVRPVVIALILAAGIRLGKKSLVDVFCWVLILFSLFMRLFLNVHPFLAILAGGLAGLIYTYIRTKGRPKA